jgi:replication factor C subunit 3/5
MSDIEEDKIDEEVLIKEDISNNKNKKNEKNEKNENIIDEKELKEDTSKMWVEKYRPNELNDLISQEEIINTIKELVKTNKLPHLLFYGPAGTGKTSTILAIAKEIYGKNYSSFVMELNASGKLNFI